MTPNRLASASIYVFIIASGFIIISQIIKRGCIIKMRRWRGRILLAKTLRDFLAVVVTLMRASPYLQPI